MNFLSIDCCTDKGSLFVKTKNKTFIKILQSDKYSNDLLMKQILVFFQENKVKFEDISHIFVNQGPGNFSSLRGSLATAKGISISRNIKLIGYNTFLWSCGEFLNKKKDICSIIKFREKYYIKNFNKNLNSITNAEHITKDEIVYKYDDKLKVIPKIMTEYFDEKILKLKNLNMVELDHNQLEFLKLGGLLDENLIKPLYLS